MSDETEDILYLSEAQDALYDNSKPRAQQLVGLIMDKFKFGYGGYNGWFKNWSDLEKEIEGLLK